MELLQLVRWPNLLIVALTQMLIFFRVLNPSFSQLNIKNALSQDYFFLLVAITLLLTAGGYIINDVYDKNIDKIDKPPHKVIIGSTIDLETAYWLYFVVHLIGFILALYLAFQVEKPGYVGLFPLASTGLYLYSRWLKRRPLIGNLLIALYCAGVAGIVWFAERVAFSQLASAPVLYQKVKGILIMYLLFAFLTTLFREIVKDMEDIKGDQLANFRTAPIAWGTKTTRNITFFVGILIIALLFVAGWYFWQQIHIPLSGTILIFLTLPAFILLWKLWKAKEKKDFHDLSQWSKFLMLGGILILLLIEI
ncbi:MAG: geranylgeranylglycerol-phosphate geranylgeranyltransferase [Saprospiraceae bacterium]